MLEKLLELLKKYVHVDEKALEKEVALSIVIPWAEAQAAKTEMKLDDALVAKLKSYVEAM